MQHDEKKLSLSHKTVGKLAMVTTETLNCTAFNICLVIDIFPNPILRWREGSTAWPVVSSGEALALHHLCDDCIRVSPDRNDYDLETDFKCSLKKDWIV